MIIDIPGVSERRKTARYQASHEFDVLLDSGTALNLTTKNISGSGIQFTCDDWVAEQIETQESKKYATVQNRFKVVINLPIDNVDKKLYCICCVIATRRLSQKEYIFSFAFTNFENDSSVVLNEYLDGYTKKNGHLKACNI